jgi:phosphate-selective porin OprO and OprP
MSHPLFGHSAHLTLAAATLALGLAPSRILAADTTATVDSLSTQLADLDQKIRVLERLHENDLEDAKAAQAKVGKALADGKAFTISSQDEGTQLKVRGFVQTAYYANVGDSNKAFVDKFDARRVQPSLEGTLWKKFGYKVQADFGGGNFTLLDAYSDWNLHPLFNVRVGKFKPPIGLERLQSANKVLFIEAGLPSALIPNRDLGVQVSGTVLDGSIDYALGVFNGTWDGGNNNGDFTDDKDVAGRVFVQPFRNTSVYLLQGLGLGIGGSFGWQEAFASSASTGLAAYNSAGRTRFFSYKAADTAQGKAYRWTPQGYWYYGPFSLLGEYVESTVGLRQPTKERTSFTHAAWQGYAGWVITGEETSYNGLKVKHPFGDTADGDFGLGAIEVLGRVNALKVDTDLFGTWADTTKSARSAHGYAIGINWYLNNLVRVTVNYEQTSFVNGASVTKTTPPATAGGAATTKTTLLNLPDEKLIAASLNLSF